MLDALATTDITSNVTVGMDLTTADAAAACLTREVMTLRAAGKVVPDSLMRASKLMQDAVDRSIAEELGAAFDDICAPDSNDVYLTQLTGPALNLDTANGTCRVLLPGTVHPAEAAFTASAFLRGCGDLLPFNASDPDLRFEVFNPQPMQMRMCGNGSHATHVEGADGTMSAVTVTVVEVS